MIRPERDIFTLPRLGHAAFVDAPIPLVRYPNPRRVGGFSALSGCGEFDPTCGPLRLASMRYDYRDQMVEYEETFGSGAFIRFQYDALGRRVSRLSLDSATYYVQGGHSAWQVLAEYDGPAATASLKADYVYGNYIDEPIQMRRDYAAPGSGSGALQTFYYHQDDLFNVVALTAGPGGVSVPSLGTFPSGAVVERYRYGDYGLPSFVTGDGNATMESARTGNPYLFTGREWDGQSRLYHYRTRYMEPTWGRFTTRDTIGIWGDLANRGNGYEYVGGRPTQMVDSLGEQGSRSSRARQRENIERLQKEMMRDIRKAWDKFSNSGIGKLFGAYDIAKCFRQADRCHEAVLEHWNRRCPKNSCGQRPSDAYCSNQDNRGDKDNECFAHLAQCLIAKGIMELPWLRGIGLLDDLIDLAREGFGVPLDIIPQHWMPDYLSGDQEYYW